MNSSIQPYARLAVLLLAVVGFGAAWSGDRQDVSHFPIARRAALERAIANEATEAPVAAPIPSREADFAARPLSCFPQAIRLGRSASERIATVYRIESDGEGWREIVDFELRAGMADERPAARIRKPMRIIDVARTLIRGAEALIR